MHSKPMKNIKMTFTIFQNAEDPIILYSFINTQLRDKYSSFEEFCKSNSFDAEKISSKLRAVGFEYSTEQNRFM